MTTTKPWERHQKVVKTYIEEYGYDNFLREPTIKGTMFVGDNDTSRQEFAELVKNPNWDSCWKDAIKDDGFGNPERFPLYPESSGNYIHCAYHLAKYEEAHKVKLSDLELILEVGCGYGAMSKVCRQAGFTGRYILFDLPIFNEIQSNYLNGIPFTYFIDDIGDLFGVEFGNSSMFISTWAVSEMPTDYRDSILNICPHFSEILLAYQCMFEGMDINSYFNEWQKKLTEHSWVNIEAMDPNHKYLFGHNFYE